MQEIGVKFLEGTCISAKLCHGNFSVSNDKQRFEISSNVVSPPRVQSFKESGFVSREFFEPGTIARSFSDVNYQQIADHHRRSIMSPIEVIKKIMY
jgi:predicted DNA-binding transcriptional regulator